MSAPVTINLTIVFVGDQAEASTFGNLTAAEGRRTHPCSAMAPLR